MIIIIYKNNYNFRLYCFLTVLNFQFFDNDNYLSVCSALVKKKGTVYKDSKRIW